MGSLAIDSPLVAIVGAGPAGMSCALWLKQLGIQGWLIDQAEQSGGLQRFNFLNNDWVLGHGDVTGPQLAERFAQHLAAHGIAPTLAVKQLGISRSGAAFVVNANGKSLACAAVVLAMGTRFRGAEVLRGVAGIETVPENCLRYGPYAFEHASTCLQHKVLIVGGGDNALENARVILAEGGDVVVASRSDFRAQRGIVEVVRAHPRCQLLANTTLRAVRPEGDRLIVDLVAAGGDSSISVDRIHVLAGYEPNTACLGTMLSADLRPALDVHGYIRVDAAQRTNVLRLYAAGDVCNPAFPNVVSAMAQGAHAAKAVQTDLEAT